MSSAFWKYGPAIVCVLALVIYTYFYSFQAPIYDHWTLISFYSAMKTGELGIGDLFALHGNHWHASGYAVQLGLSDFTNMSHWAESLASIAFAVLGFVALMRMLTISMDLLSIWNVTAWVFGISAFFLFSFDQSFNWLMGWQVAVFINLAGALWTIERLSVASVSVGNTVLAAIACAIAVYAFGTGWALIPIGFALLLLRGALRSDSGQISLLIWIALTALLLWHFYRALNDSAASYSVEVMPDFSDWRSWVGLMEYTGYFLASPLVRFARDSGALATILGGGVLIWACLKLRSVDRRQAWRASLPFLAMAAYAAGSGLLTALGRWAAFGSDQAFTARYISFGNFYWIAVFTLAIFAIAKSSHRTHKRTFAFLGLFLIMKIGNQPSVIQRNVKLSNNIAQAAEQVAASYPHTSAEQYSNWHASFQDIDPLLEALYQNRASLFATVPEGSVDAPRSEDAQ